MWENKPTILLLLATAAILVGTIITMILPFFWVNTESDQIAEVTPYSALELAGRDIYVREGCNNCHSQTVRPLVPDVLRYGPYSKSGEFVYDRPFLWGSRRMGPDLARLGGKYPDEWHQRHMVDPRSMEPDSNMPSYRFLNDRVIDPAYTMKKMKVLGFPYSEPEINNLSGKTEMEAIIAYMQKLGADWPRGETAAFTAGENPYAGDTGVLGDGREIYEKNCAACHGVDLDGDIGAELEAGRYEDDELFEFIYNGVTDAGMPAYSRLGADRIWKLVTYIQAEDR